MMRALLADLLDWAEMMGGWEAPVWERAKEMHDALPPKEDDPE
jgi:hypothetical protein